MQRAVARKAASRQLATQALQPVQKPEFNWNKILTLLPHDDPQSSKLRSLREEIEQGWADSQFSPAAIPAIDWDEWKQRIKTPGVVDAVRTALEAQTFEVPADGRFDWENYKPQFKDPKKLTKEQEAELEQFDLDSVRMQGELAQDMLESYEHDHAQIDDHVRGFHLRTLDMDFAEFPELAEMVEEFTYHDQYFPTCSYVSGATKKFITDMDLQFDKEFDWAKCMPEMSSGNRDVDRQRLIEKFVEQNKAKYAALAEKVSAETVAIEPVLPSAAEAAAAGTNEDDEDEEESLSLEEEKNLAFASFAEVVQEDFQGQFETTLAESEKMVNSGMLKYLKTSLLVQKYLNPLLLVERESDNEEELPASVKTQREQVYEILAADELYFSHATKSDWAVNFEGLLEEESIQEVLAEAKESEDWAQQLEEMKLAVFRYLYEEAQADVQQLDADETDDSVWPIYYQKLADNQERVAKQFGYDFLKGSRVTNDLSDAEYRVDKSTFDIGREVTTEDMLAQASYTHRRLSVEELIEMSASLKQREAELKAAAAAKLAKHAETE